MRVVSLLALDKQGLDNLAYEVCSYVSDRLLLENRTGGLESYLKKIGFYEDTETTQNDWIFNRYTAKVMIIGFTHLDKKAIDQIASQVGIDPRQIEFVTNEEIKRFNYGKLKFNYEYSDIIIGPIHHKGKGVDGSSSPISMIEANPKEYPNLVKAVVNNELKITKDSLHKALKRTIKFRHLYEI